MSFAAMGGLQVGFGLAGSRDAKIVLRQGLCWGVEDDGFSWSQVRHTKIIMYLRIQTALAWCIDCKCTPAV